MTSSSRFGTLFLTAIGTLIVAASATLVFRWLMLPEPVQDDSKGEPDRGFRECALQCGLNFRMAFLPKEQGEKFKINLYDHGSGVAIADYDGDGHDDIYFVNQLGPNALYRNRGDGTFIDVTPQAGVALGDRVCVSATFADYDNDGHKDLYVLSTRGGNVLFRNQGNGTFKDVTREAGLMHVGHSQSATFFDYDGDGRLDLFVTNTARWTLATYDAAHRYYPGKSIAVGDEFTSSPKESNILYRNNGDGTFSDVTKQAGLSGRGWSGDAVVLDYNQDGRLDLMVGNMFGPSQLYRNNGDGTFTNVTREALGPTSFGCCGVKAFDFNNDGKLDLFLADMHSDMWMGLDRDHASLRQAKTHQRTRFPNLVGPNVIDHPEYKKQDQVNADLLGYRVEEVVYGNTLFKNRGNGKFEEVSGSANMETFWPWGVATGDFDNDGHEDVFMPSGMGYPFYYWPNQLMMNNGNETFCERGRELGIEPPVRGMYLDERIGGDRACRSSRSAAVADFDGDGRLDIVTNNFNDQPYYFRNKLPARNYLAFRLRGTKSNRDAIGAVVTLHLGKEIMVRQVAPAGGFLSQSSHDVHFGLGDRSHVDQVRIRWPSGIVTVIANPAINRRHDLTEAP